MTDKCANMIRISMIALALSVLAPVAALAELSVPQFFSDRMVLQREASAAIWGKADPGAKVTVSFKGATAVAKADGQGRWKAKIKTGKPVTEEELAARAKAEAESRVLYQAAYEKSGGKDKPAAGSDALKD